MLQVIMVLVLVAIPIQIQVKLLLMVALLKAAKLEVSSKVVRQ